MLSDTQIRWAMRREGLAIDPFEPARLQAASLDVTLADTLQVMRAGGVLDPRTDCSSEFERVTVGSDGLDVEPGMFVLGSTQEAFAIGPRLVGKLEGKSSLGRLGLIVHATAGFLDPGFRGQVTLEMSTCHDRAIRVYAGMPIGQVAFDEVRNVAKPYDGKYVGQRGPTLSRYHQNWDQTQLAWR